MRNEQPEISQNEMRNTRPIPRPLQSLVERELESGERIEWMEMPQPRFFTPVATAGFLFGIPWTAFALFWTAGAALGVSKAEGFGLFRLFPLFGIPFVLIGFGLLSGPIWARRDALRTVYAITNRRAISVQSGRTTTFRSFTSTHLQDVYRRERRDGTGDVIFPRRGWRDTDSNRQSEDLGFLSVRNPKRVESLLRQLATEGSSQGHAATV